MYALLADLLTFSRVITAGLLVWVGVVFGADGLAAAVVITILTWTTDQLDGWAARRSSTSTRLGPYDFPIDVAFYLGLLGYLTTAGFLPVTAALVFLAVAGVAWLSTRRKAVGVLCVRMIDLYAAGVLFAVRPLLGFGVLGWLLLLVFVYRRRLSERLPRWLGDIRSLFRGRTDLAPPGETLPEQPLDKRGLPF